VIFGERSVRKLFPITKFQEFAMRELKVLVFLLFFFTVFPNDIAAQPSFTVVRLADVRSVYVDENSFWFVYSSCGTSAGGMILPCPKHARERGEFLAVLKRWLGKSGFIVAASKADADGIIQGTLHVDDSAKRLAGHKDKEKKKDYRHYLYEPEWSVNAWMVNQDGEKLWTIGGGYPGISYKISSKAKIEGKKAAKAIEHDFKRSR
jgi:hypothetical protein